LENLTDVDFVENVKSNKQLIHLKSNVDVDLSINQIIKILMDQNCKIRSFTLLKPSLEDVYLKLVGGETI